MRVVEIKRMAERAVEQRRHCRGPGLGVAEHRGSPLPSSASASSTKQRRGGFRIAPGPDRAAEKIQGQHLGAFQHLARDILEFQVGDIGGEGCGFICHGVPRLFLAVVSCLPGLVGRPGAPSISAAAGRIGENAAGQSDPDGRSTWRRRGRFPVLLQQCTQPVDQRRLRRVMLSVKRNEQRRQVRQTCLAAKDRKARGKGCGSSHGHAKSDVHGSPGVRGWNWNRPPTSRYRPDRGLRWPRTEKHKADRRRRAEPGCCV